jgi:hypothetical protein
MHIPETYLCPALGPDGRRSQQDSVDLQFVLGSYLQLRSYADLPDLPPLYSALVAGLPTCTARKNSSHGNHRSKPDRND